MVSAILIFVAFAAVEPPAELAALRIQSQPGVEVIWEGVSLGSTDRQGRMVVDEIPPGSYSIALRKRGYRETTREIELHGGETNAFVIELEAIAPPPRARPAQPKAPAAQPEAAGSTDSGSGVVESNAPAPPPGQSTAPTSGTRGAGAVATKEPALDPVASAEATEPAEAAEPAEATGRSWRLPLIVLGVLLFGTALYLAGRFRAKLFFREWDGFASEVALEVEKAVVPPPRGPEPWERPAREGKTVSPERDEPAFIEDLKRREKDLVRSSTRRPRRREPAVIDADFTEIKDV